MAWLGNEGNPYSLHTKGNTSHFHMYGSNKAWLIRKCVAEDAVRVTLTIHPSGYMTAKGMKTGGIDGAWDVDTDKLITTLDETFRKDPKFEFYMWRQSNNSPNEWYLYYQYY
jgi:hypothetical protein